MNDLVSVSMSSPGKILLAGSPECTVCIYIIYLKSYQQVSARRGTARWPPLTYSEDTALTTGGHTEHGANTVCSGFFRGRSSTSNTSSPDTGAQSPCSITGNPTGRQGRRGQTGASSESSTRTAEILTGSSTSGIVSGFVTTGGSWLTDWLGDVGGHPAVSESSVEPHVAVLPPARPPGVLDQPEVPAVVVRPVAHHGHGVGPGHVAGDEEPE